jgi:hypothetical protein
VLSAFLAVLALGPGLAAAYGSVPAHHAGGTGWRKVAITARKAAFTAVAAGGSRHAWAVGVTPAPHGTFASVVYQQRGSAWIPVQLPPKVQALLQPRSYISAVSSSGTDSLWAFNDVGSWLHYNGSDWTAGQIPGGHIIDASADAGQKYIWAFGLSEKARHVVPFSFYASEADGTLIWTGKRVPGKRAITAASAVSASDLWAVTGNGILSVGESADGLLHFDGRAWRLVALLPPPMRNDAAHSILAAGDGDIWVGGAIANVNGGTTEAVAHWDGSDWTVTALSAPPTRAGFSVVSIVSDGSGGLWALANCAGAGCPDHGLSSRLWHEQSGQWSGPVRPKFARHPAGLSGLAATGNSVWAAGTVRLGAENERGLIALWGPG